METSEALRWAAVYLAWWLVASIAGLVVVGIGVALGGLGAIGVYGATPVWLRVARSPTIGLVVIVLGFVVWRFGSAAALVNTVVSAVEARMTDTLDTESLKSDILSVLDDRLADMHQELSQTKLLVDRISRDDAAEEFEFGED